MSLKEQDFYSRESSVKNNGLETISIVVVENGSLPKAGKSLYASERPLSKLSKSFHENQTVAQSRIYLKTFY